MGLISDLDDPDDRRDLIERMNLIYDVLVPPATHDA